MAEFDRKLKKFKVNRSFKESIEPEEILFDATKSNDLEDQKLEVPLKPRVFRIFFGLIVLCLTAMAVDAGFSQIVKGKYYQNLAERNSLSSHPVFAPRGIIYDRTMKQLVYNVPSFDLVVTPHDLPPQAQDKKNVLEKVAAILEVSADDLTNQIDGMEARTTQSYTVAENLPHQKVLVLQAELPGLAGFRVENTVIRQYVDGQNFAHVIGYMGKLTSGELEKNPDYFSTEKIGKSGLELFYEKMLRGTPGKQVNEVDSQGRFKRQDSSSEAEPGQGLVLSLDADLQTKLIDAINTIAPKQPRAAAVALDPQTGGVLALVSLPSFDNNLFAQGISQSRYEELRNDPIKPFLNRVITGQYSPGSTVKPMIAAAALQEKIIDPKTTIVDTTGEITVVNQYNPNIVYRYRDWKIHGVVDMKTAIAQSCDVYFYTIGGGYGKIEGLGLARLNKYFKLFGFGSKTGIDLFGESQGLVPDEKWKQEVKKEGWYTGDTYHLSIGQGDLLATPLQLAVATASLVNGGRIIVPHLVDKIIDSDKNVINQIEAKALNQGFIDGRNLETIKQGMRETVISGSAKLLGDLPVAMGAKTGTAQVNGQDSNAWVTVFAPYDDPQIVLVVLVEDAGEGSQIAVPIAKEVLNWYFNKD